MPVVTLKQIPGLNIGPMVLTCPKTGLPQILGNLWLSLNELKYSSGYTAQHLRALDKLYAYFEKRSGDLENLDKTVLKGDVDSLIVGLRGFIAERQNISASTGKDQSVHVQMACSVITSILDEIRFRNNSPDFDAAKVSRSLSSINTLYHFLRPPRASKIRKVRSLPASRYR